MKYKLGEVFSVLGVEGTVAHINRGFAWLVPVNEGDLFNGHHTLRGVAFAKLDANGRSTDGVKAHRVMPVATSGAV